MKKIILSIRKRNKKQEKDSARFLSCEFYHFGILAIVMVLAFPLAACGINKTPEFISGEWPNNEWTEQLQKPSSGNIGDVGTLGDQDQILSIKMNWTREEAVEYAIEMRDNGFDKNVFAYYEKTPSLTTIFEAENSDGRKLTITESEIRIVKP